VSPELGRRLVLPHALHVQLELLIPTRALQASHSAALVKQVTTQHPVDKNPALLALQVLGVAALVPSTHLPAYRALPAPTIPQWDQQTPVIVLNAQTANLHLPNPHLSLTVSPCVCKDLGLQLAVHHALHVLQELQIQTQDPLVHQHVFCVVLALGPMKARPVARNALLVNTGPS